MPITNRKEAKESAFAQVREALTSFEGDVTKAEFGLWGVGAPDPVTGKVKPPREFLEIESVNNTVLASTEPLSMDISPRFSFRVNCSDYKGTFWVETFLDAADKLKLLIPDDLRNKRVRWQKVSIKMEIKKKEVIVDSFVPIAIVSNSPTGLPAQTPQAPTGASAATAIPTTPAAPVIDPLELLMDIAIGRTEQQFRSAVVLDPRFKDNPLLPMVKAGFITDALIKDKKITLITENGQQVYKKV